MFGKIKIFDHGARRSGGKLKKVVKCDVTSYIKILYIENCFDIQTIPIQNNSTLK
nr:MAG TPA: hypothetical protein [Caudoviricetes sp.]